jgi:3',5'-cyclic AMP phosphodiesterase CpdA
MQQLSRRTFLELASLASVGLIGGCGEGTSITGAGNFSIPVFSDVHFQPFIAPAAPTAETLAANAALVAQLDAADASQWPAILLGPANTLNFPLSAPGADTNYTLMALALASIRQNLGTSPAVLFTGDFLGHSLYQLYLEYSVNKTDADAAAFVDKTLAFVLQQIRAAVGAIPVYFALGNCDSYTGHGPNNTFLENNARSLYSLGLNGTGNQQDVIGSITNGGYYAVEPAGMNLMIIALNTIALSPSVTADSTMIAAQFKWLDAKLAAANTTGKKVWLLMHAPPGVDEATTGEPGNDNGEIATATMMWVSANQTKFLGIIQKYPGVIAMSLAGHTHMDEFRLMTTGNTLAITAGISPVFGNNPAYKIFSMDRLSLAPNDYSAVNCNLLVTPSNFNNYYTFSQAYDLKGPLAPSLARLFPMLHASNGAQEQYQGAFHSGNNTSNPITTTNWPVYWCGIGFMDQQEFFTAVNRF